jgi:hypothetical protein
MLAELVKQIFDSAEIPEVLYKRCEGMLSLQRKTDPSLFEKACQIALENNVLTYKFLQRVIENKALYNIGEDEDRKQEASLPQHQNIRGKSYYY